MRVLLRFGVGCQEIAKVGQFGASATLLHGQPNQMVPGQSGNVLLPQIHSGLLAHRVREKERVLLVEQKQVLHHHGDERFFVGAGIADAVILPLYDMLEIYMLTSLAPIPVATLSNREMGSMGQNYLKSLFAIGFQGLLILLCVGIYAVLIQGIATGGDPIGAISSTFKSAWPRARGRAMNGGPKFTI